MPPSPPSSPGSSSDHSLRQVSILTRIGQRLHAENQSLAARVAQLESQTADTKLAEELARERQARVQLEQTNDSLLAELGRAGAELNNETRENAKFKQDAALLESQTLALHSQLSDQQMQIEQLEARVRELQEMAASSNEPVQALGEEMARSSAELTAEKQLSAQLREQLQVAIAENASVTAENAALQSKITFLEQQGQPEEHEAAALDRVRELEELLQQEKETTELRLEASLAAAAAEKEMLQQQCAQLRAQVDEEHAKSQASVEAAVENTLKERHAEFTALQMQLGQMQDEHDKLEAEAARAGKLQQALDAVQNQHEAEAAAMHSQITMLQDANDRLEAENVRAAKLQQDMDAAKAEHAAVVSALELQVRTLQDSADRSEGRAVDTAKLESELGENMAEAAALRMRVAQLEAEHDSAVRVATAGLEAEVNALRMQVGAAEAAMDGLQDELRAETQQKQALAMQVQALRTQVTQLEDALDRQEETSRNPARQPRRCWPPRMRSDCRNSRRTRPRG
jgi:chromosome segregation ATPase